MVLVFLQMINKRYSDLKVTITIYYYVIGWIEDQGRMTSTEERPL